MSGHIVDIHDRSAWNSKLATVPHSYWQSWDACHAYAAGHGRAPRLWYFDDGEDRAACVFTERDWKGHVDVHSPVGYGGLLGRGDAARMGDAWRRFAAERGYVCGYFAIHPVVGRQAAHFGVNAPNDAYVLNLCGGSTAVEKRFHRSVRRSLRVWKDSRSDYVVDRLQLTEFLAATYAAFMAAKGVGKKSIWPESMIRAMCAHESLLIVGATDSQGICAVHTFVHTPGGAECHLNVSVRDGRKMTPGLLWWGIRRLAEMGTPWLQMGAGASRGDPIAASKQKYGPVRLPLPIAREVYRADLFAHICESAGAASDAAYFPPYHQIAPDVGLRPD